MPVDSTIQNLPAVTSVASTDVLHGVSDPSGTPSDRKYTIAQIVAGGGLSGAATPEGATAAVPGALYWSTDDQALYVKNTGTGTTGWLPLIQL